MASLEEKSNMKVYLDFSLTRAQPLLIFPVVLRAVQLFLFSSQAQARLRSTCKLVSFRGKKPTLKPRVVFNSPGRKQTGSRILLLPRVVHLIFHSGRVLQVKLSAPVKLKINGAKVLILLCPKLLHSNKYSLH